MRKERIKILHQPTTLETFYCLSHTPAWVELLHGTGKPYEQFLIWLKKKNYFQDVQERTTIKWMSNQLGFDTSKVTKWIKQAYKDILDLNYDEPEKFKTEGIMHELHFRNYDDSYAMTIWLLQTPRLFERFDFYFIKAKMGTDYFWVSEIRHQIQNGIQSIQVTLKGGFCNPYREQLLSRALFEHTIGFMDLYDKHDFEIDEFLLNNYRR